MSASDNESARQEPAWRRAGRNLAGLGIVLLAFTGVLLLAALLPSRSRSRPPTEPPPVNVKVLPVEPIDRMRDTFDLPGVVAPNRVVSVSAEVAGRIERVLVEEGQTLKQGQDMIRLNTDLLQAQYDRSKAQLEFDRREYERMASAAGRGVATDMEVDQARTRLAISKATCDEDKAKLDRSRIPAPISGVLDRLPVEQGEYVMPGTKVAELVDMSKAKVVLDVPERDVPYLNVGQSEEIFLDGASLTGKITFIGEQADEASRTTRVELTVDNPGPPPAKPSVRAMRSGRIVRVRVTRQVLHDVVMIPLEAVIPLEDEKAVYVCVGDRAERRTVKLGLIKGWSVRVHEGLSAGDRLIVSGHRYVAPGQRVKVIEDVPATAPAGGPAGPTNAARSGA